MKILMRALRGIKERVYDFVVSVYYFRDARRRNRKYVVLGNPHVGICNRLIALANTYSWFGKENISLVWAMDSWVPTPFEELFEMTDAPGFEVESHQRNRWSRYLQIPMFTHPEPKWWNLWAPAQMVENLPEKNLRCLYNQTPMWACELFKDFFSQLKPSKKVADRIAACNLPEDVVCVQIRNTKGQGDIALVAPPERFIAKMRSYGPTQRFFVSCMNAEVSALVHAEFGDRAMELPNKNYKSMVDAVADLWLLGAGRELICQFPSSFGEIAWWWHGGTAQATALGYEYRQMD